MSRLFRAEVLANRQTQFLGTIRIGRNPSFTAVTVVAVVLAACLVAYAVWGEVTRKERLTGVLIPTAGMINLSSPQAGTLTDVRTKEGDSVEVNQVLMVVSTDRTTSLGDAAMLIAQSMAQQAAPLHARG